MQDFDKPIPQTKLDIIDKIRSNLFAWRGQFSPQLIEVILSSYCPPNSIILDPFAGSGTVLLEVGFLSFESYGFEINPAAWILGKIYEFINESQKKESVKKVRAWIDREFPFKIFENSFRLVDLAEKLNIISNNLDNPEKKYLML